MVILFLIVLWAIVLGPTLIRRWSDGRFGNSIGAFNSHLRVLRRTNPADLVPAAHYLRDEPERYAQVGPLPPPARSVPVVRILRDPALEVSGPVSVVPAAPADHMAVPGVAPLQGMAPVRGTAATPAGSARAGFGMVFDDLQRDGHPYATAYETSRPWSPARRPTARDITRKRRRDTLVVLGVAVASCLALGSVPTLRPIWYVAACAGAVLVTYVGLVIRYESLAYERREKVVALSAPRRRSLRSSSYVTVESSTPERSVRDAAVFDESVVVVSAVGGA